MKTTQVPHPPRTAEPSNEPMPTGQPELAEIRAAIDDVDERILDLMLKRQRLALATLAPKARSGLPPTDVSREAAVVARGARLARERGLEPELVRDVFWRLIELSRAGQRSRPTGGGPA